MNTDIYSPTAILHFGVGNFHRSHQAYAVQKLWELDPERYSSWGIVGVSFLPADVLLIEQLKRQEGAYHLKMGSPDGAEELLNIQAIRSVLHAQEAGDATEILERIASEHTKVISFTITEGGYNIDFDKMVFDVDNPAIVRDLADREQPQTVFGFLAKGLLVRMQRGAGAITLLSCDNILKNGKVLQLALESFIARYDVALLEWVRANVSFPNSMVDRITPATTEKDMAEVQQQFGVSDPCLVVAESFFQWVIEADKDHWLYPLHRVGVTMVDDVDPFEEMKLFILNGGHTLTGLLGDALGYDLISDAVKDTIIAALYDRYVEDAVIPILHPIRDVDFNDYYAVVKSRFGNRLIKDTTARIISGSSDKIPKFILPVMTNQATRAGEAFNIVALIVAAWWYYLDKAFTKNNMADVQDRPKGVWLDIFADRSQSATRFLQYKPVFGELAADVDFVQRYEMYVSQLQNDTVEKVLKGALYA